MAKTVNPFYERDVFEHERDNPYYGPVVDDDDARPKMRAQRVTVPARGGASGPVEDVPTERITAAEFSGKKRRAADRFAGPGSLAGALRARRDAIESGDLEGAAEAFRSGGQPRDERGRFLRRMANRVGLE